MNHPGVKEEKYFTLGDLRKGRDFTIFEDFIILMSIQTHTYTQHFILLMSTYTYTHHTGHKLLCYNRIPEAIINCE